MSINESVPSILPPAPVQDAPDVFIVGDQYQELVKAKFSSEETYIEGGVWYVEKVLKAGLLDIYPTRTSTVETYPIPRIPNHKVMAKLVVQNTLRQPSTIRKEATRIASTEYYNEKVENFDVMFNQPPKEFVVIEDMNMGYRDKGSVEWTEVLKLWSKETANGKNGN